MRIKILIGRAAAMLLLTGCGASGGGEVEACTQRGVAYFQEIGSYPTLSDGRSASVVAAERCNRTTTAF